MTRRIPKEVIDLIRGVFTLYAFLNVLSLERRLYKEMLKAHNLTEEEFEKLPEEEQEKLLGGPGEI